MIGDRMRLTLEDVEALLDAAEKGLMGLDDLDLDQLDLSGIDPHELVEAIRRARRQGIMAQS